MPITQSSWSDRVLGFIGLLLIGMIGWLADHLREGGMKKKLSSFAIALALAMAGADSLLVAQSGPNGTAPRPFYVMAHNPNMLEMAELALLAGANALEPDVEVLQDGAISLVGVPDPPGMVMYHDYTALTARVPLTLEEYLDGAHELAKKYPRLALIMLDVKPEAAQDPNNGKKILDAIHDHLNHDGVNLNVIINVGTRTDAKLFTNIYSLLGEREGVSIDGEDNPVPVVHELQDAANGNISYGDGTIGPGPNVPKAIDWGSFLKTSWGFPKVIADAYTIETFDMMGFFIEAGADGVIPDHLLVLPPVPPFALAEFDPVSVLYISDLLAQVRLHPEVRLATRDDNPFRPNVEAYGLKIRTGDDGTDGPLTFTLEGCRGSSNVTVHTGLAPNFFGTGRMEAHQTDHVTIRSLDLGRLTKLTIFNDGELFDFPNWSLQDVRVSSARYLGPDRFNDREYIGTLNDTIKGGTTRSVDLTANFDEPLATIECPAPITIDNAPGQCGAPVSFAPKVDGMCPGVTAVSTPASGSTFSVGTTNVSAFAQSGSFQSPSCLFTVTVKDVEGPQISCPAPITADATSPSGAAVTFAPAASDNCSATITSAPASGSLFAIGTSTVSSTAQDPAGSQSSCSFTVHVNGAAEQITDLIAVVNGMNIKDSVKNSLLAKLNAALANLANKTSTACGPLADFISLVSAQQGKSITGSDAASLIAKATQIRTVIGC